MFLVERLTKCRTTSGSESSGSGSGVSLMAPAGSRSSSGFCGTSHAGIRTAQQPGLESSNRSWVDWVLCIFASISVLARERTSSQMPEEQMTAPTAATEKIHFANAMGFVNM